MCEGAASYFEGALEYISYTKYLRVPRTTGIAYIGHIAT